MPTHSLVGTLAPFPLPLAPPSLTGPVKAWSEAVALSAYEPAKLNKNPAFPVETGSRPGYPLPLLETPGRQATSRPFQALHIENEFLRLMILPEIGGRIHLGLEKTSGQEFLYREETLTPDATGFRIRGGLEVNWPTDPRPRSLATVTTTIEEHADGSRTVWCSAYDPLTRLKGMHGVCLYPGRAYLELKVRLTNRTSFPHVFNWSVTAGVPAGEGSLNHFPETGAIPQSFWGCYGPATELGLIQVADQHSAGGQAFELQPGYGELRAGMYSAFPPGTSKLLPSETKSFSQFWYPFNRIGSVRKANVDAAVCMSVGESVAIGVVVTRPFPNASVVLETEGTVLNRWTRTLAPGEPLLEETTLAEGIDASSVTLKVLTSSGRELLAFTPALAETPSTELPSGKTPVSEPLQPRKVATVEDLYFTGLRVQGSEGSHPKAEHYWQEALRRDPHHSASNNAIGLLQLGRGEFGEAEEHFRRAIATAAATQFDGRDGEFFYNLGLSLRYQERDEDAYGAFQRASWSFAWRAPSLHAAAELDCKRGNFGVVPKYLYEALRLNADNNNARSLAVVLFRRFGRAAEAEHLIRESLILDPLDPWACHLAGRPFPGDNQVRLDLAFDYARAGLFEPAIELLTGADTFAKDGSLPMVHYTLATFYMRVGDFHAAQREFLAAASTQPDYVAPHRLEEMMVLARAIALQPQDSRAQYYLGNLLYHYGLPLQAIEIWQSSAKLDETFPTVWRNLAIGHYNVTADHEKALDSFDQAFAADRTDACVFYERDQLWQRLSVPPQLRFQEMQEQKQLADSREDLALELATLYNTNGEPENALSLFSSGRLEGWEQDPLGVEQYVRTFIKLGRKALAEGENERARDLFLLALSTPAVSRESSSSVPKAAELQFWLGEALKAAGHQAAAHAYWQKASSLQQAAGARPQFNDATFFVALSFGRIGDRQQSRRLLRELWFAGRRIARENTSSQTNSATSSVLKMDAVKQQRVRGLLLQSQARVGLGQYKLAARLLEQLLALDPNNGRALDLISDLEQATQTN